MNKSVIFKTIFYRITFSFNVFSTVPNISCNHIVATMYISGIYTSSTWFDGFIFGLSQFLLSPPKMLPTSQVVKSYSKIIISLLFLRFILNPRYVLLKILLKWIGEFVNEKPSNYTQRQALIRRLLFFANFFGCDFY